MLEMEGQSITGIFLKKLKTCANALIKFGKVVTQQFILKMQGNI